MRLGGWTRLWIVVTVLYGVLVAFGAYNTLPQLEQEHAEWIEDASNVIAERVSQREGKEIASYKIRERLLSKSNSSDAIAWLEKVVTSPTEEQQAFSSAIAKVNEKHRRAVEELPVRRREHMLLAAALWLDPSCALFALGRAVGWVILGFRKRAV